MAGKLPLAVHDRKVRSLMYQIVSATRRGYRYIAILAKANNNKSSITAANLGERSSAETIPQSACTSCTYFSAFNYPSPAREEEFLLH